MGRKKVLFVMFLFMAHLCVSGATLSFTVDGISYFVNNEGEVQVRSTSADAVDAEGTLTIPASVTYEETVYRPTYLYSLGNNTAVKKLVIKGPITKYYSGACTYCTNLEAIDIQTITAGFYTVNGIMYRNDDNFLFYAPQQCEVDGKLIDNYTGIFQNAFYKNQKITKIDIPATCKQIQSSAFYGSTLQELSIAGTAECDSIPFATFCVCKNLTKIDLGSNVKYICDYAFSQCGTSPMQSPTHVNPSTPLDLSHIVSIGEHAFAAAGYINYVTFGSDLESMAKNCFSNSGIGRLDMSMCTNLTTLPEFAFYNCGSLYGVGSSTLPPNLEVIGDFAFAYDSSAFGYYSVTLPEKVDSIGKYVFVNSSATSITLPAACQNLSGLTFAEWRKLKSINLSGGENHAYLKFAQFGKSEDPVLYTKDGKKLICYPMWTENPTNSNGLAGHKRVYGYKVPAGVEIVTDGAFANFYDINSETKYRRFHHITLPNSVKYVGYAAFYHSGVEDITIPAATDLGPSITLTYSITYSGTGYNASGRTLRMFDDDTKVYFLSPSPRASYKCLPNYGSTKYYIKRSSSNAYKSRQETGGQNSYDKNPIPSPIRGYFYTSISGKIADSGISTMCRDFDVDFGTSAVTAYVAKEYNTDGTQITSEDLPEGLDLYDPDVEYNVMKMEPIQVEGKTAGKYIPSRTSQEGYSDFHGVVLKGTPGATFTYYIGESDYSSSTQATASNTDGNMLGGVPVETWVEPADTEGDKTNFVLNSGFFKYFTNAGVLNYQKAYLQIPNSLYQSEDGAKVRSLVMLFNDCDTNTDAPTAIDSAANEENMADDNVYYNLQGMRVMNPTSGIFILNGKKIYRK